jgi:hypothetical protein
MTTIHAKTIIDGKFWIVEENDTKVGILKLNEQQKYVFSSANEVVTYDNKKKLVEQFGSGFFLKNKSQNIPKVSELHKIHEYPTSAQPFNPMFDVKKHLPLFTKSDTSKSVYCAGYYIINFNKRWVKSFCPKLITLERYQYQGPFKTELEMKHRLSNVTN